jgi:predicted membrane chloride channel (bestrophin family)
MWDFRLDGRPAIDAFPYSIPCFRVSSQVLGSTSTLNKLKSNRFVVGLAITFRMQSSYSRWWEGREQWDKLSAACRSFSRTIWLHVPLPPPSCVEENDPHGQHFEKVDVIRCVCTYAVALKHHLRGEREWTECSDLKPLLAHLPNVC